jgi:hypothetical protein
MGVSPVGRAAYAALRDLSYFLTSGAAVLPVTMLKARPSKAH